MNEVSKEEFFNLRNLLRSYDKEVRFLGQMIGLSMGILINENEYKYSFQFKNSFGYIGFNYDQVSIPSKNIFFVNPSEEIGKYIE